LKNIFFIFFEILGNPNLYNTTNVVNNKKLNYIKTINSNEKEFQKSKGSLYKNFNTLENYFDDEKYFKINNKNKERKIEHFRKFKNDNKKDKENFIDFYPRNDSNSFINYKLRSKVNTNDKNDSCSSSVIEYDNYDNKSSKLNDENNYFSNNSRSRTSFEKKNKQRKTSRRDKSNNEDDIIKNKKNNASSLIKEKDIYYKDKYDSLTHLSSEFQRIQYTKSDKVPYFIRFTRPIIEEKENNLVNCFTKNNKKSNFAGNNESIISDIESSIIKPNLLSIQKSYVGNSNNFNNTNKNSKFKDNDIKKKFFDKNEDVFENTKNNYNEFSLNQKGNKNILSRNKYLSDKIQTPYYFKAKKKTYLDNDNDDNILSLEQINKIDSFINDEIYDHEIKSNNDFDNENMKFCGLDKRKLIKKFSLDNLNIQDVSNPREKINSRIFFRQNALKGDIDSKSRLNNENILSRGEYDSYSKEYKNNFPIRLKFDSQLAERYERKNNKEENKNINFINNRKSTNIGKRRENGIYKNKTDKLKLIKNKLPDKLKTTILKKLSKNYTGNDLDFFVNTYNINNMNNIENINKPSTNLRRISLYDLFLNENIVTSKNNILKDIQKKNIEENILNNSKEIKEDERITMMEPEEPTKRKFNQFTRRKKVYDSLSDDEGIGSNNRPNYFYFNPLSKAKIILDFFNFMICIYTLFIIPLRLVFYVEPNLFNFVIELFCDTIMTLDVFLGFITAFYDFEENFITSFRKTFTHYIRKYFFCDILCAIPFNSILEWENYITLLNNESLINKSFIEFQGNFFMKNMKFIIKEDGGFSLFSGRGVYYFYLLSKNKGHSEKIFKILRALKIFKIFTNNLFLDKTLNYFVNDINFIQINLKLFSYCFFFIIISHILTCIFIFLGTVDYPNWIIKAGLENKSFAEIYLSSLYFNHTSIFTVGYGDIITKNIYERLYNIILMIVGIMLYSYALTSIANIIRTNNDKTKDFEKKKEYLEEVSLKYYVNRDLFSKLCRHLFHQMKSDKNSKLDFLNDLPITLRNEMILNMHRKNIESMNFFKNCYDNDFIIQVFNFFYN